MRHDAIAGLTPLATTAFCFHCCFHGIHCIWMWCPNVVHGKQAREHAPCRFTGPTITTTITTITTTIVAAVVMRAMSTGTRVGWKQLQDQAVKGCRCTAQPPLHLLPLRRLVAQHSSLHVLTLTIAIATLTTITNIFTMIIIVIVVVVWITAVPAQFIHALCPSFATTIPVPVPIIIIVVVVMKAIELRYAPSTTRTTCTTCTTCAAAPVLQWLSARHRPPLQSLERRHRLQCRARSVRTAWRRWC